MPKKPEVILGIDPGYDRVGWAVGVALRNQWQLIHYGVIQTDRALPLTERYQSLTNQLTTLIKTHSPQIAVIESLFFFKNQKTAKGTPLNLPVNLLTIKNTPTRIAKTGINPSYCAKASVR